MPATARGELHGMLKPDAPTPDAKMLAPHWGQSMAWADCQDAWLLVRPEPGTPQGRNATCRLYSQYQGKPMTETKALLKRQHPKMWVTIASQRAGAGRTQQIGPASLNRFSSQPAHQNEKRIPHQG